MLDNHYGPIISISINSISGLIATLTYKQIRLYSINGELISYINLTNQHQQQQQHDHHQYQQNSSSYRLNNTNILNDPTVILVTPCPFWQDGIKLITGHKGGYIYLWKLRKFKNDYDDNKNDYKNNDIVNSEHGIGNNNSSVSSTSSSSSSSSSNNNNVTKNKIHSYITIKNESQFLELYVTSIPTRTHKASITTLKLCSTNSSIKSKEIISRSLEDNRYLDLFVGDNDGYISRWSALKLDQLTSFDLLSVISDI